MSTSIPVLTSIYGVDECSEYQSIIVIIIGSINAFIVTLIIKFNLHSKPALHKTNMVQVTEIITDIEHAVAVGVDTDIEHIIDIYTERIKGYRNLEEYVPYYIKQKIYDDS